MSWRRLERELIDILRQHMPSDCELQDYGRADTILVFEEGFGEMQDILNISALARELDARGIK